MRLPPHAGQTTDPRLSSPPPPVEAMSSSSPRVAAKAKACADRRTTKPVAFNVAHAAVKWKRRALKMSVQILSADGGRLSVAVRKSGQIRDLRAAIAGHPNVYVCRTPGPV